MIAVSDRAQHVARRVGTASLGLLFALAALFIRPNSPALPLGLRRKRGFDGYVRDYGEGTKYTLVFMHFNMNRAIALTMPPAPAC
ncbi:MAG TPA: hypothetical protein VLB69_01055 [Rudaea sp.]|nr:hypothetical protein [Rudaea sp.]